MVELLTQKEVASLLRLSPRTVERLRTTGMGPKFTCIGGRRLYRRNDVEAWVNSNVASSTAQAALRRDRRRDGA